LFPEKNPEILLRLAKKAENDPRFDDLHMAGTLFLIWYFFIQLWAG
jgi:hypothetical protein